MIDFFENFDIVDEERNDIRLEIIQLLFSI